MHTEVFDPGDVGGEMGEALVTLELTEQDGVTTMSTSIDYGTKDARDAALSMGMTDGIEMSYRLLDDLLAGL